MEDAFTLTLLLTAIVSRENTVNGVITSEGKAVEDGLLKGLKSWQDMRQKRIDEIFDYATNATNVARMSEAERHKLIDEGKAKEAAPDDDGMEWLYRPMLEEKMKEWLSKLN